MSTGLAAASAPIKSVCSQGHLSSSSHNMVALTQTLQPAVGAWPGSPTCTGLSPWASPDKARSSRRPALSMTRAAPAVNSTWMAPTMTEARLLSWGDGQRQVRQRPGDKATPEWHLHEAEASLP